MYKKLKLMLIIMLALICLISGGVFAAPQSSPNVSRRTGTLKDWAYDSSAKQYIPYMRGSTGAMGNTGKLDVHLQRNTEYGAMLILGLSDYGKQASSVRYDSLFSETANGLATTTGNVSGIYEIVSSRSYVEHVAAGKPDSTGNYYLYHTSLRNRDEYKATSESGWNSTKRGDAMNLFSGTNTASSWFRREGSSSSDYIYYYGLTRSGFSHEVIQTYDASDRNIDSYDNGKRTVSAYARAVVTQYN